jgi:hypothetical protein
MLRKKNVPKTLVLAHPVSAHLLKGALELAQGEPVLQLQAPVPTKEGAIVSARGIPVHVPIGSPVPALKKTVLAIQTPIVKMALVILMIDLTARVVANKGVVTIFY